MASMIDPALTNSALRRRVKRKFNRSDQQFFIPCAPGLESILSAEAHAVSAEAEWEAAVDQVPGGVIVRGHLYLLYLLNLHLRTANRVLLRVSEFWADSLPAFYSHASRVPWETLLGFASGVAVRTSSTKSRLSTGDALEDALVSAINLRFESLRSAIRREAGTSTAWPTVYVRVHRDHVTLSIDTTGEHLHKRGYRIDGANAPLRTTLASALLIHAGWERDRTLVDPFCGSGTIAIEAAIAKSGRPTNGARSFAFEQLPFHNPSLWDRLRSLSRPATAGGRIVASDIDPDAVRAAGRNAIAAGVGHLVEFYVQDAHRLRPSDLDVDGNGWIVSNLPYGVRLDVGEPFGDFAQRTLEAFRENFARWRAAFATPASEGSVFLGLADETVVRSLNGGIAIDLTEGRIEPHEDA